MTVVRPRPPRGKALSYTFIALGALIAGIVIFYVEEDWRGKTAWERYKRTAEARKQSLDWIAYIPTPVKDDQNAFKAPRMTEWFINRTNNELASRLSSTGFLDFLERSNINTVAEVTVVGPNDVVDAASADIVLRYNSPFLNEDVPPKPWSETSHLPTDPIPLIVVDEVPAKDAIKNLARSADLKYMFDPAIRWSRPDDYGNPLPQPCVSGRWTNVTARQTLVAVLNRFNLQLNDKPDGPAVIKYRDSPEKKIAVAETVSEKITKLFEAALGPCTNRSPEPATIGPVWLALYQPPFPKIKPLHVVVRSEKVLFPAEVAQFFPADAFASIASVGRPVHVSKIGENSFRVTLSPESYTCAADYLAWSDQFQPEFDMMRDALKRPYAFLRGEYRTPEDFPYPNFSSIRVTTQALAQRAQCWLVLSQPEQALRELMLLHDLFRLMDASPGRRGGTLVSAMMKVAVTGIYAGVIADGTRLHAWTEPQLIKLEEQLKGIELLPSFVNALGFERAVWCRVFETANPTQCNELFAQRVFPPPPVATNLVQLLQDPVYLFCTFAPRGWIYRNMLNLAVSKQKAVDCLDAVNCVIRPCEVTRANAEIQSGFHETSAQTVLAARAVTDTTLATMTLAFHQTRVREAVIACALERYRFKRGYYPDKLDALVPEFIQKIPPDVINGGSFKYCGGWAQFALYSIGWKEKDNGGVANFRDNGSLDMASSDWVWPNQAHLPR